MTYGKKRADGSIQVQEQERIEITISNPTERQRELLAEIRGELPVITAEKPIYDDETQKIETVYEEREENGKKVLIEVHTVIDREPEEIEAIIEEKQKEREDSYCRRVNMLIRMRYSEEEEIAIHRKKIAGIDDNGEFEKYNDYVTTIKARVKEEMEGELNND